MKIKTKTSYVSIKLYDIQSYKVEKLAEICNTDFKSMLKILIKKSANPKFSDF